MERETISFPTKVDRWLAVVLGIGLAVQLGAAASMILTPGIPYGPLVGVFMLFFPVGLVAILSLPTRYELHPEQLVIRSGVIRYRIPYSDLREVHPTNNPLSAPAWSLDRLKLVRSRGYALVSPDDKPRFLHELSLRAPQLTLQGDRLVSR